MSTEVADMSPLLLNSGMLVHVLDPSHPGHKGLLAMVAVIVMSILSFRVNGKVYFHGSEGRERLGTFWALYVPGAVNILLMAVEGQFVFEHLLAVRAFVALGRKRSRNSIQKFE